MFEMFHTEAGRGYYVIRLITGGYCYQGVGLTFAEAWKDFIEITRSLKCLEL
jgi:hypothetical protein